MDGTPAAITLPAPAMDAALRQTLQMLRDYCHDQGELAFGDGYTGMGWYELHDYIDDVIPAGDDVTLDGEPQARDVDYFEVQGVWK